MKFYPGIILLLTLLSRVAFAQNVGGDTAVCAGNYRIQLRATPPGGVWSGDSVTPGGSFRPDTLFLPQRFVTLTYTLPNGNFARKKFTIKGRPRVTINTNDQNVCANAEPIQIDYRPVLAPPQGVWTGQGVSSTGLFTPIRALVGAPKVLRYTVDTNGCPGFDEVRFTVKDFPNVTAGSDQRVCKDDDPVLLTGGTPAGGTYSAAGPTPNPALSSSVFDPKVAVVGVHRIRYTSPPNADGCTNTAFLFITVNDVPVVKAGKDTTVCANAAPFNLQNSSPAGGTWTPATKVSFNGRFTPSNTLAGFNQLFYTVTNTVTGCSAADTLVINVISIPSATQIDAGRDTSICANNACFAFVRARPAGGKWYNANETLGDSLGITDSATGRFCPSSFIAGTQIVRYIVRNGKCKATDSLRVNVRPLPRANAGVDFNACSGNAPVQVGDLPLPVVPGLRYKYKWTGPDGTLGFSSTDTSNPFVNFVNGTPDSLLRTYILQVTQIETGQPQCSNFDTLKVVIYPKPVARTIPPLKFRGCEGDTIILRAETRKKMLYQWLNGSTILTQAPTDSDSVYVARTTGRYRLIVVRNVEVRGGSCADTSTGDSVFIKDKVKPTILGFPNFCRNRTDTLVVDTVDTQNFAYQWLRQEILTDSTFGPPQIIIGARDTVYNAGRVGLYSVLLADNRFGIICYDTSEPIRVDSIRTPFNDLVGLSDDSVFSVCTGQLPYQLKAPILTEAPTAFQYLWQDSTTSLFNIIDTVGTYYVRVFNRCGAATDTLEVTNILPTPTFNILTVASKDTLVCKDIPYLINLRNDGDREYYWYDSAGAPMFEGRPRFTYQYPTGVVTSRNKIVVEARSPLDVPICFYRDSAFITVVECEPVVYIPTAFSPQGDNINDKWILQAYSVSAVDVRIFNRWGEQVYAFKSSLRDSASATEVENFNNRMIQEAWDGTYNDKPLPSSAYQYVITYSGINPGTEPDENGRRKRIQFKRSGMVTLLR